MASTRAAVLLCLIVAVQCTRTMRRDMTSSSPPRILTQDGHLIFQTAENHNITLNAGGTIIVDNLDLRQLILSVTENNRQIEWLKSKSNNNDNRMQSIEDDLNTLHSASNRLITEFTDRINRLTDRVTALEESVNNVNNTIPRRRLNQLENRLERLSSLLGVNECSSNPCRHGGTCIDQYNGFYCYCSPNWQGSLCQDDVNECATLQGTDLGCQNGATCVNTRGSYRCVCPPNWYGQRCSEAHDDCSLSSNEALCGHGTCHNLARTESLQPNYQCLCDAGWTKDANGPMCNTDVNECNSTRAPCSVNPVVECINTPGSFVCSSCPPGFSGNGFTCLDINECEANNGGCSLSPRVPCINTFGSRTCGHCPSGYSGDGITCEFVGVCAMNNGGCHALAACQETPGVVGRACRCPAGYIGNGEGTNGCQLSQGPCANNPCGTYGHCEVTGYTYRCVCNIGWSGPQCNLHVDLCASNPCLNNGTCITGQNATFTCSCPAKYTGRLCQEAQRECGGILDSSSGVLSYPSGGLEKYPNNVNCIWVIRTEQAKSLVLTVRAFKLEAHSTCAHDFLQIHDGASLGSHRIGRFCGSTNPGSMNTTHYAATLWFHSDSSVNDGGFTISWTSTTPNCGGRLTGSYGIIRSPAYPGHYPPNRICSWTVSVPPGNRIVFTMGSLDLELSDNCTNDYLEIRDGQSDRSTVLNRFCGSITPAPVETTGPYAYVYFVSGAPPNGLGFSVGYSTRKDCGGELHGASGVIRSPNYPYSYPHNAVCIWTIIVGQHSVITFNITNMDLERHVNCQYDYVEVRDGDDELSPFVGRYCGNSTPPVFVSRTNKIWIKFQSDATQSSPGFAATWDVACGGLFTSSSGYIISPNFPDVYPSNKECIYVIRQPEGSTITLTFLTFDLHALSTRICLQDFLEVRNGDSSSGQLISRVCGSVIPRPIQSTGNLLWLRFVSNDDSYVRHGFRIHFEASNINTGGPDDTSSSGCGGTLTSQSGTFTSPGHPAFYPNGVRCTWFIRVTRGFVISLAFHTFVLDESPNCSADYVEVFDNYTTVNSLAKFCGRNLPPSLISTDNVMTVAFVTNGALVYDGFSASYTAINATVSACGQSLVAPTGVIETPSYPNNYPHDRQCVWVIHMPSGQQIKLNVTDFELESDEGCHTDFLEIRNGGYADSPLIGSYCGTEIAREILSHTNSLYLKFVTSSSVSHRGFRIYYDGAVRGCGGELRGISGSLISPNYPLHYELSQTCIWSVTVAAGSKVQITFNDIDIIDASVVAGNCFMDFIELRDSGPQGPLLQRLCGSNLTLPVFESISNQMWIMLRTDSFFTGRGFYATYQSSCNTLINKSSGIIESPNFPFAYPRYLNCSWIIQGKLGNTINASFVQFEVEGSPACQKDYVELRDGQTPRSRLIGRYCGQVLPSDITTTQAFLYINFVSDSLVSFSGFRIQYVTNGCGEYLTSPFGQFTSPNYPQFYPQMRECLWTIAISPFSRIKLIIHDFNIETSANCTYDALQVFDGMEVTSPQLAQLCVSVTNPQTITSSGNFMTIHFKSDINRVGRGFNISYESLPGGCGGNYSAHSGNIMSPNYPHTRGRRYECIYQITVEPQHQVVLSFQDFDIDRAPADNELICTGDFVAVYEDADFSKMPLLRSCGNVLPSGVRSRDNTLFVRFRTLGSVDHRGFNASYTTGCGGTFNADAEGELRSPGWPHHYPVMSNCTWILEASTPGDHVMLTLTHMDISSSVNCTTDFLNVMDGSDLSAPVVGTYCGSTVPAPIRSVGSSLIVYFVGRSVLHHGFQAHYSTASTVCGATYTSEQGHFTSPNFPNPYLPDYECVWNIATSAGNRIMLSFSSFDLESSDDCIDDFVEIREGGLTGQVKGRYCGSRLPPSQTILNNMWIRFRSNNNLSGHGFTASYSSVYGGDLEGNEGQVASPRYPANYPNNANYMWTITVDTGMRIKVMFQSLDIEKVSPRCSLDNIQLWDGVTYSELGIFCGTELPSPVYTSSNRLRIHFASNGYASGQGFLLYWNAVSAMVPLVTSLPPDITTGYPGHVCGGNLYAQQESANLTSPNYPDKYIDNLSCTWIITAGIHEVIFIEITDLNIEDSRGCTMDYLHISDGMLDLPRADLLPFLPRSRLCGNSAPADVIVSRSNYVTIRFRTDGSITRRGFALNYRAGCGGFLMHTEGRVRSPQSSGTDSNYRNGLNCLWHIMAPVGMVLHLNFTEFNIVGEQGACTGDYLEIFNGQGSMSPLLGKFCGSNRPDTVTSASNYMTIRFVSDNDGQTASGFTVFFSAAALDCSRSIDLSPDMPTTEIASPNYPENYPGLADCSWVVNAPADRRVRLSFTGEFAFEQTEGCVYDYVEVRDGANVESPLLARYCNNIKPQRIFLSTSQAMFVRFRVDATVHKTGFKAQIGFVTCGGSIVASNGTITSPNYPDSYSDDMDCEWFVEAPRGHYIQFSFSSLHLEHNANCSLADFIEIRDFNATGALLITLCGTTSPLTSINTSDSFAYVRFHSNLHINNTGFQLNFVSSIEECGGILTTDVGVLQSPNYPGLYPHSRQCHWIVRVRPSQKISLHFVDLDITDPTGGLCFGDHVQVINGYLPKSPEIGRYCSLRHPFQPINSTSNSMTINFRTDHGLIGRGFKAIYSSDEPIDCGGTFCPLTPATIQSPGFELNATYSSNMQCIWTIDCQHESPTASIKIEFLQLDLESHVDCVFDFVELREGTDEMSPLMGRFCRPDNGSMPYLITPLSAVWLRFVTDNSRVHSGFQLNVSINECGGWLTDDHGIIESPTSSGGSNVDCAWVIDAPVGYHVQVSFTVLSLTESDNCTKSFIEILNGYLPSAPSTGRKCSTLDTFTSQSHHIRLIYHSDADISATDHFEIQYDIYALGCGGTVSSEHGIIRSPQYPHNYSSSSECVWNVIVPSGYHVEWTFSEPFNIEQSSQCVNDYVQISQLTSTGDAVGAESKYCGSNTPSPGKSSRNRIQIKFRSDEQNSGSGFSLNFTSVCGAVYDAQNGTITSPGYPDYYPSNLNCTYDIIGDADKNTLIHFFPGRFNIFDQSRGHAYLIPRACMQDYLEISAISNHSQPVRRLCGKYPPSTFTILGGVRLRFVSDESNTDHGWMMQFAVTECGGTLTESSGTLHSVLYPDKYHDNANCTWIITVPDNKLVKLTFEKFSIEPHASCQYDYVAVYNGLLIDSSKLIGRYCGSVPPVAVVSNASSVVVNFVTDSSRTHDGFVAKYTSVYGAVHGCGGILNLSDSDTRHFTSPDIDQDGNYENDLECNWQILVPQNSVVMLQFTRFSLAADHSDYVEVYDGFFASDTSVGNFTGERAAFNITSSSNSLYVKFVTDSSTTSTGFSANVHTLPRVCGGLLQSLPTPSLLTFGNITDISMNIYRCRWIINAPADEHVEVNVTIINLPGQSCAAAYLELKDHPMNDRDNHITGCMQQKLPVFTSVGLAMQVNFFAENANLMTDHWFTLTYQTASCNRTLTDVTGRILSPKWPGNYPVNARCEVKILTPEGYKLSFFFSSLSIEHHSECAYDYLAIFNGTNDGQSPIAKLCGRVTPLPVFLDNNVAHLKFVTDISVTHGGYDITYISSPSGCGGELQEVNGTFASPGFPQSVNTAISCNWTIVVPSRRHITLKLNIVPSLITSSPCGNSYVRVHEVTSSGRLSEFGTYCQAEEIAALRTSSGSMIVSYVAGNSTSNVVFTAQYWSSTATRYVHTHNVADEHGDDDDDDDDATYIDY